MAWHKHKPNVMAKCSEKVKYYRLPACPRSETSPRYAAHGHGGSGGVGSASQPAPPVSSPLQQQQGQQGQDFQEEKVSGRRRPFLFFAPDGRFYRTVVEAAEAEEALREREQVRY